MVSLRSALLGLPMLALLGACAGKVEVIGVPGGDDGGASGEGGDESLPPPMCPDPSQVGSNVGCSVEGQQCRSFIMTACDGGAGNIPIDCTCMRGTWECASTQPTCTPVGESCPYPQAISPGSYCNVDPALSCSDGQTVLDCQGNPVGTQSCQCSGNQWECNDIDAGGPCDDSGSGCPGPFSIVAGAACSGLVADCPGNPQMCGGVTVYDAFNCVNSVWVDVAPTVCDVDSGFDAGPG